MVKCEVNRQKAATDDSVVWNAYIHVLAMSDPEDLTPVQEIAHLAFWYDSEVQNGGHLQYFLNRGIEEARAALEALPKIGAHAQRAVLASAVDYYVQSDIGKSETAEEYDALWGQEHFDEQDDAYYECVPEMTDLLQQYLDAHVGDFIEFTDQPVPDPFEFPWHVKLKLRIRRLFGLN